MINQTIFGSASCEYKATSKRSSAIIVIFAVDGIMIIFVSDLERDVELYISLPNLTITDELTLTIRNRIVYAVTSVAAIIPNIAMIKAGSEASKSKSIKIMSLSLFSNRNPPISMVRDNAYKMHKSLFCSNQLRYLSNIHFNSFFCSTYLRINTRSVDI